MKKIQCNKRSRVGAGARYLNGNAEKKGSGVRKAEGSQAWGASVAAVACQATGRLGREKMSGMTAGRVEKNSDVIIQPATRRE